MSISDESTESATSSDDIKIIKSLQETTSRMREELSKVIIGQDEVIEKLLICILSKGHGLLMGVPGLAKTTLVNAVAEVMSLDFSRIQFTPDLMPSDITGTDILQDTDEPGKRAFVFVNGPLFANIILADEINRTPPKTQSALLEAMQEKRVTANGKIYPLPSPFFVLATQNPIEQEGTYALPEAQLDRFMFLINVEYPTREEEREIARQTTRGGQESLKSCIDGPMLEQFQSVVERLPVPDSLYDYAVDLIRATRPKEDESPEWLRRWVSWGAGPRAVQYIIRGAKARAVLNGSFLVRQEDIEAVAYPVLSHRLLTNFQAQSEGKNVKDVIERLIKEIRPQI